MSDHDSHDSASHGAGHDDHESHGGTKQYMMVFVALCVLTTMSFFTYSSYWPFHSTPAVGWVFMMAVSCTKAMLVMLFFMHLMWEASWKYVLTVPASIMSMFLCLSLVGDVGQRTRYYQEERWIYAATPIEDTGHHGDKHDDKKDGHDHSKDGHSHDHGVKAKDHAAEKHAK